MNWDELASKYGGRGEEPSWEGLARRYAVKAAAVDPKPEPVTDFSGNLRLATPLGEIDTGLALPEGVNRRLAQLGSGFGDYLLRLEQLSGRASEQEAAEKSARDRSLNDDFTGKALNFAGKVAPLMGMPAVGGPVTTGALAGAVGGFMEPVRPGDSAIANTALGAGLGAALPAAGSAIKAAMRPDAATREVAQTAMLHGIPLSPGDLTRSRVVKATRSVTDDIPLVGLPGQSLRDAQQAALNRAVGQTIGARANQLTPDVVDAARKRMGAEFDRIWKSGSLEIDAPMLQQLQSLRASAGDLPAEQARRIVRRLDDFLSHAQPGPSGTPMVSGEAANAFQKWLRETGSSAQSALSHDASTLRRAILEAFNRSNPGEAAALALNRNQYKALKTIEPLLDKGAAGVGGRAAGDIPAALLPDAVRRSYSGLGSHAQRQPLVDLAQVSGRFLTDRVAQSGGSPRALVQNSGVAGILGTGFLNPVAPAVTAGVGLGVNAALNSPRLGRALLDSTPGRLSDIGLLVSRLPVGLLGHYGQGLEP